MRGETENSSQNHLSYENIVNTTNPKRARGKKAARDCIHLENRAELTKQVMYQSLDPVGPKPFPHPRSPVGGNGAGKGQKPRTAEEPALEICFGAQTYTAWCSGD